MKREYRNLRLKQLAASLDSFGNGRHTPRPLKGWLRSVREALGITQRQIADELGITRQSVQDFETAEAGDRITLRNLRRVAEAMGCVLVYSVVPKSGTIQELADREALSKITKRVLSVEHSMALEGQAPGGVRDLIDEEAKRKTRRS